MGRYREPFSDSLAYIADAPVVFNYLVIPEIVEAMQPLMADEARAVDYPMLPWQELGASLNTNLANAGAPSDIHVYVGNDGFDVADLTALRGALRSHRERLAQEVFDAVSCLSLGHYRRQTIHLSSVCRILHGDREAGVPRPPVAGIVVGIQFSSVFDAVELSRIVNKIVLGAEHFTDDEGAGAQMLGRLPSVIAGWLQAYGGTSYGSKAWFVRLPSVADGLAARAK